MKNARESKFWKTGIQDTVAMETLNRLVLQLSYQIVAR